MAPAAELAPRVDDETFWQVVADVPDTSWPGGEGLAHNFDVYQRRYYDTATWLAETLDGAMLTRFEYTSNGHDIYAGDGSSMRKVFQNSLKDAERLAAEDPKLAFVLRRSRTEWGEFEDMLRMVRGELPNVMVVESDIAPEVVQAGKSMAGFNAKRKQTMQRVITWDGRNLAMESQSLDGSDREGLEAVYAHLGEKPQPGELLGQRIHKDMPVEDHTTLSARLTGVYDRTLAAREGGEWHAGRRSKQGNAYQFVLDQHQLLHYFATKHLHVKPTDEELYNLAALMRERFNAAGADRFVSEKYVVFGALNPEAYMEVQMSGAGSRARSAGVGFYGCGMSLEEQTDADRQHKALGYGDRVELHDKLGSRTFYCSKGHENFRRTPNVPEKTCWFCGEDVSCQPKRRRAVEKTARVVMSLWKTGKEKGKEVLQKRKKLAPRTGRAVLTASGVTRGV